MATSARMMAESAARAGWTVVALDAFGDLDTRRAAQRWVPIAEPGRPRLEEARLLAELRSLAAQPGVAGWVAGGGFEGRSDLLAAGAAILPLIGTAPEAVRRVRDPASFFEHLQRLDIPHPPTLLGPPATPAGWLLKDLRGTGGWQVRRLRTLSGQRLSAGQFCQREMPGQPMSATFVANGEEAVVLGVNALVVERVGTRPFVYAGAIGPLRAADLPVTALAQVHAAVQRLSREFGLRGLAGLDFLRDGNAVQVLELNPRPVATLALYDALLPGGAMGAHVLACVEGRLPAVDPGVDGPVGGHHIVYARRPFRLGPNAAEGLVRHTDCHDLPAAGTVFARGDPVCSLSTTAADPGEVRQRLVRARDILIETLETQT